MKKSLLKPSVAFLAMFLLIFLLMSLGLWILSIHSRYAGIDSSLKKYVTVHEKELRDKVFNEAFINAKACSELKDKNLDCEKAVSRHLGESITEEELAVNSSWPDDLFFVKETANQFYRLGWSGKIENVTSKVDQNQLVSSSSYFLKYVSKSCKPFKTFDNASTYCEVFVPLSLSNSEKGYVARLVPITEESEITFFWVWPIFLVIGIIPMIFQFDLRLLPYIIYGISLLIVPFFGARLATKKFFNQKTKKKKLK